MKTVPTEIRFWQEDTMSIKMINLAVEIEGITTGQKCVLLLLANRANSSDLAWPTVDDVAKQACMTTRGVRLCINELQRLGLISKIRRSNKSNLYQLTIGGCSVPPEEELSSPQIDEQGGTQFRSEVNSLPAEAELSSGQGGTEFSQTQKNHQLTIIEPKEEYLENLNVESWQEYISYREEMKFPKLKAVSEKKQKRRLARFPKEVQAEAVDKTIASGWQGLFPEKIKQASKKLTYAEQIAADLKSSGMGEGESLAALE
jgi:Helix-turn-helix domain